MDLKDLYRSVREDVNTYMDAHGIHGSRLKPALYDSSVLVLSGLAAGLSAYDLLTGLGHYDLDEHILTRAVELYIMGSGLKNIRDINENYR